MKPFRGSSSKSPFFTIPLLPVALCVSRKLTSSRRSDMDDSIRLTRSMATRTPSSPFPTDPTEQRKTFDVACHKLETYLQQHPGSPTSFVKPGSIVSGKWSGSSSSGSQQSEEELCCLPPLLNLVHPSKRLCRTIRVWVAWKP